MIDVFHLCAMAQQIRLHAKGGGYLPPGVVFMTFHFKEAATNLLTLDVLDPVSKIPELKVCVLKIQKL
jgi:predicted molibdopterin-dependent oxidoreductase YjgC